MKSLKKFIGGEVTDIELMLLYRKRMNLNQEGFGKIFGAHEQTVAKWENGQMMKSRKGKAAHVFLTQLYKQEILDGLKPHEVCYLIRKRKGLLQKDVAKQLGISRTWLNRIENGLEKPHSYFKLMTNAELV